METDLVLPRRKSVVSPWVAPGLHLLADFHGARHLRDIDRIEAGLRKAAAACGATVLGVNLHSFGKDAGVTGVAILAESHISIHTWPEISYAAIDIFVCGKCDPYPAVAVLEALFEPEKSLVSAHERGAENGMTTSKNGENS